MVPGSLDGAAMDLTAIVLEWYLSRQDCFHSESDTPEMWQRHAKAEKALIEVAKKLEIVRNE